MRKHIDMDIADVDPDGLADGNSSAGTTLTLDGALTSGGTFTSADGLAHRLSILDLGADDQTSATYTITGTDASGVALTEDIAGPGASATVTTSGYFLTVSSVTIASPVAGSTVDMGTVDEIVSRMIPLNWRGGTVALNFIVTGTISYTVQQTTDDLRVAGPFNWTSVDDTDLVTATTSQNGSFTAVPTAFRAVVNSYSSGAELALNMVQSDV